MRVYVVGGAVRDGLLGLPVQDHDYVVVGATPEEMTRLGFQPVGKDFPVFLHPHSHEEYALARTERKTARGYKGFQVYSAPDVSLEEDLIRRDLTVNAMAQAVDGRIIDPHGGQADLAAKVLRHVSPAFAEDPVRILRLARFAARFAEFTLAPETLDLMRAMVADGEVDALVPERVWQELARGLMEAKPSRMLSVLRDCGALARLMPEVDALFGVPQPEQHHPEIDTGAHLLMVIDQAAADGLSLAGRWAALLHDLGKGLTPAEYWPRHHGHEGRGVAAAKALSERLRAPSECRDLAVLAAREHGIVHRADELRPATVVELLERTDAFRRPDRFAELLRVCAADARGRLGRNDDDYPQAERLGAALAAARGIDAGVIARASAAGQIPAAIHRARVEAVRTALGK
ncbi:MAG: multifunctional CCA addition/repair protein [Gallionellaceae bacterium]|nr:multifunctional CCA addition/repair protein [Gallionellaceae bacterium]